jgi:hypothetical protein
MLPILAGTLFSSVFDAVRGSSTRVEPLPLPMLLESEVLEILHSGVEADVLSCWGIGLRFAMANPNPRAVGTIARAIAPGSIARGLRRHLPSDAARRRQLSPPRSIRAMLKSISASASLTSVARGKLHLRRICAGG